MTIDTNGETSLSRETRDGLFAPMTGLAVVIAISMELLVNPLWPIPFPLLALVFAVPLSTLRVRAGRTAWLGVRYTAACCVSVLGAFLPFVLMIVLPPWGPEGSYYVGGDADAVAIAAFLAEGALSGWLAVSLQGWASREPVRRRWSPRSWGPIGKVGGTLALAGLAGWLWTGGPVFNWRCPYYPCGPSLSYLWVANLEMGVVAIIGFIGVVVEGLIRLRPPKS